MASAAAPPPSTAVEDYLKAVFALETRLEGAVPTTALANRLGITPGSVSAMLRRLADLGLLAHEPYRGVLLTEEGRRIALRTLRSHRLLELFLVEVLDVPWDRVHDEAERLEHAITPYLEERIDARLGYPGFDPHGAPIPTSTGTISERDLISLSELPPHIPSVVRNVPDDKPELLRLAAALGLLPNVSITVLSRDPADGSLEVISDSPASPRHVTHEVANSIFVNRP
jgi:DtxR family Mn-dependent transcriptional regulator